MKLVIAFILMMLSLKAVAQHSLDGIYRGLQPKYWTLKNGKKIRWKDTEHKDHYWYSLITIKIRGDSVFLDDSPISLFKRDTIFSASDGGFFYYRGILSQKDSLITFNLQQWYCDYCGIRQVKDDSGKWVKEIRRKIYTAKRIKDDLLINGYLFGKKAKQFSLLSEGAAPE